MKYKLEWQNFLHDMLSREPVHARELNAHTNTYGKNFSPGANARFHDLKERDKFRREDQLRKAQSQLEIRLIV